MFLDVYRLNQKVVMSSSRISTGALTMVTIATTLFLLSCFAALVALVTWDKDMAINAILTLWCALVVVAVPHVMKAISKAMEVSQ
jgi:hypothetical protein